MGDDLFNFIGTSLSIGTYLQVLIAMGFFLHRIHSHMAKVSSAYGLVMMATNIFGIPQCFVLLYLLLSSSMKFSLCSSLSLFFIIVFYAFALFTIHAFMLLSISFF